MSTKGIIFSAGMVRALLDGRKTQTRRLITKRNEAGRLLFFGDWTDSYVLDPGNAEWRTKAHGYRVGDRLYVRENWRPDPNGVQDDGRIDVSYPATYDRGINLIPAPAWKLPNAAHWGRVPCIHMPRWASRLWLLVTDVRVQRLQAIGELDAIAEGCYVAESWTEGGPSPRQCYADLWGSLHDKPGERWDDDPWVVAVSFEVHRGNIDEGATT